MFKLDLENAEEPEIKLPTSVGVALMVQERAKRMKQNTKPGAMGPEASIGLRCRVHSESSFYS